MKTAMSDDMTTLPEAILAKASLDGNEYAWRISDIPAVIEAVRQLNMINIGGQLQFRIPAEYGSSICECYWVEVDTYKSVAETLPWSERVQKTAEVALKDFLDLQVKYDFLAEGRSEFGKHLKKVHELGGNAEDLMCFVWYACSSD